MMDLEPLLDEKNDRNTIFPIVYSDLWAFYKKQESLIWHSHEIKLDADLPVWNGLTDDERHFIKYILAFFASSDKLVADNLCSKFQNEIKIPEVSFCYGFQTMMEGIHSEVYCKLIDAYIPDEAEKMNLFNAVETIPCIKAKADWARLWMNADSPFAARLISFACVEGILFSGAFCSIYWLNESKMMGGLSISNDFISRDESIHTEFACHLYKNYIVNKLPETMVHQIISEAVDLEIEFICNAIPCRLLGMNSDNMSEYIKFVANRLLQQLGVPELYKAVNPFSFMDRIALRSKSNFFEHEVTEYRKFDNEKLEDDIDPYEDCF